MKWPAPCLKSQPLKWNKVKSVDYSRSGFVRLWVWAWWQDFGLTVEPLVEVLDQTITSSSTCLSYTNAVLFLRGSVITSWHTKLNYCFMIQCISVFTDLGDYVNSLHTQITASDDKMLTGHFSTLVTFHLRTATFMLPQKDGSHADGFPFLTFTQRAKKETASGAFGSIRFKREQRRCRQLR